MKLRSGHYQSNLGLGTEIYPGLNSLGLWQLAICLKKALGRGSIRKSEKADGMDGGKGK